ncbi:MAG: hypothetical protein IKN27_13355 [Selenomonadaceae bacterium]|nr:hypothetical protein [Selenomonadaceae bacterium]
MTKLEFLKNAIDTLREMERNARENSEENLRYFDRFVRTEIFGGNKIELTPDELDALQDYYIATL